MIKNLFRRLRGAFGTATVWAATWFLAAFPLHVLYWVVGIRPGPFWGRVLGMMMNYGGIGFLAGGVFSLYLGVAGRNQRLRELRAGRVGLGSALTVGVVVPGIIEFFGDPQISLMSAVMIYSTFGVFAGATALAQVKIAQKALEAGDDPPAELSTSTEQLLPTH